MTLFNTLSIALISAVFTAFLGGVVASLAAEWYRVTSFEGTSSYLVLFVTLGCFVGGLLLGGISATVVARSAHPGLGSALLYALLPALVFAGLAAGALRAYADVPPTLKGEKLMLLVEVRWPAAKQVSPQTDGVVRFLELRLLSNNTLRVSKQGPLWMEDARLQEGRWVVPGAVELFSNRGDRVITVQPEIAGAHGVLLPMHGTPAAEHLQWSEWLPRALAEASMPADQLSYRYKVVARSQPSRTETIGQFQVETIADRFFLEAPVGGQSQMTASAEFAVRYKGELVTLDAASTARLTAVATLPGLPDALLVQASVVGQPATCSLVMAEGQGARTHGVSRCADGLFALPLTNDAAWREAAKSSSPVRGRIDRSTFMHPGTYLFEDAMLDATQRVVRHIKPDIAAQGFSTHNGAAPLGISPDGRSFVRLGQLWQSHNAAGLLDFDAESQTFHLHAIDVAATRYAGPDSVGLDWLNHYYHWVRDTQGHDRLTARTGVKPLPYRGILHTSSDGSLQYQVQPAGEKMSAQIAEFLRSEFDARNTIKAEFGKSFKTDIGDAAVHVLVNDSAHQVVLYMTRTGKDETELVRRIGHAFDAALATGKYDDFFEQGR